MLAPISNHPSTHDNLLISSLLHGYVGFSLGLNIKYSLNLTIEYSRIFVIDLLVKKLFIFIEQFSFNHIIVHVSNIFITFKYILVIDLHLISLHMYFLCKHVPQNYT